MKFIIKSTEILNFLMLSGLNRWPMSRIFFVFPKFFEVSGKTSGEKNVILVPPWRRPLYS